MANEAEPKTEPASDPGQPIVVWLRDDLRLDDNPALAFAAETGRPLVPVFVLDEEFAGMRSLGGAHRWWLHHSLEALDRSLRETGARLTLRRGPASEAIPEIVREVGARELVFNRRYDRASRAADDDVCEKLKGDVPVECFTANILHDPDAVRTTTGGYYKVYTPFWRKVSAQTRRDPIDAPKRIGSPSSYPRSDALADWNLLPKKPDWSGGIDAAWTPGEAAALDAFRQFCDEALADYSIGRDRPSKAGTSRMSPHLRWGEVSPYRLWQIVNETARENQIPSGSIESFLRELVWRDFNYHLLYHFGPLATANFNSRFDRFPWRTSEGDLVAWQRGQTGYPIVDAGMRQLWQTGWMHNRVRLIVGSFLTKHLLIDWREGERWFWDTLVDGDIASNTSQWQWIAGSGADAQPYFRILNPITQSERFDRSGGYIRRFVPELKDMPDRHIHAPWKADEETRKAAGIVLGTTYPHPIVDHAFARERALAAYNEVRR